MRIKGINHIQFAMPACEEPVDCSFYLDLLGIPEIQKPDKLVKRGGWLNKLKLSWVACPVEAPVIPPACFVPSDWLEQTWPSPPPCSIKSGLATTPEPALNIHCFWAKTIA